MFKSCKVNTKNCQHFFQSLYPIFLYYQLNCCIIYGLVIFYWLGAVFFLINPIRLRNFYAIMSIIILFTSVHKNVWTSIFPWTTKWFIFLIVVSHGLNTSLLILSMLIIYNIFFILSMTSVFVTHEHAPVKPRVEYLVVRYLLSESKREHKFKLFSISARCTSCLGTILKFYSLISKFWTLLCQNTIIFTTWN